MTSPSDLLVKNLLDEKDKLDKLRIASVPPVRGYAQGRQVPSQTNIISPENPFSQPQPSYTSDTVTALYQPDLGTVTKDLRPLTLDEQLKRTAEAKGESHYFNPEEKSWKLVTPPKEQPLTRMPFTQPEKAIPSAELPESRQGFGFVLDIMSGRKTQENPQGLDFVEYSKQYPVAQAAIELIPAVATIGYAGYLGVKSLAPLTKEITNKTLQTALNRGLDRWIFQNTRNLAPKYRTWFFNWLTENKPTWVARATENYSTRLAAARATRRGESNAEVARKAVEDTIRDVEQRIATLIPKAPQTFAMSQGGLPSTSYPAKYAAIRGISVERAYQELSTYAQKVGINLGMAFDELTKFSTPKGVIPERIPLRTNYKGANAELKRVKSIAERATPKDIQNLEYMSRELSVLHSNVVRLKGSKGATDVELKRYLTDIETFFDKWLPEKKGQVLGAKIALQNGDKSEFVIKAENLLSQGHLRTDALKKWVETGASPAIPETGKIIPKPAEVVAPEPTTMAQEITPAPEVTTPVTVYGFGATAYEQKATVNMIQLKDQEWVTWIDPDGNRITGKVMGEAHIERAGGEGKQQGYTIAEGNPSPDVEVRDLGVITDRRLSLKYPNSNKAIVIPTAEVTMPPSTSVQTGLAGMERPAQVKMFEEVSGKASQKVPLTQPPVKAEPVSDEQARMAMEEQAQIEGVKATLETDPVASLRLKVGNRNYAITDIVDAKEKTFAYNDSFTLSQAKAIKPYETFAEENKLPNGRIRADAVLDDLADKYTGGDVNAFIDKVNQIRDMKAELRRPSIAEPIPQAPETAVTAVEPTSAIDMPQERISPPLGQPPDDVPPSNPTEVALVEGVPSEWEGIMPNLRSADEIAKIMFREDDWRVFANLPMMRQIMSHFNPAAIADNPSLKYKVIRAVLRFESTQRSAAVLSHLEKLGNQEKIFGKLDDKGFIASDKLKGLSVNDIRTYPKKYVNKLTEAQKWWINNADEIEKAKLDFLRRNDININELSFEEGGQYAGRRWLFKRTSDGTIVESGTIGTGGARPGKKLGVEKHRVFSSQKEGIEVGFYPMPEDAAIALNVKGAFQRVADKEAAEWLLSKVDWRTTKAPDDLILAAESAKSNLQKSKQLLAALNRAVRGERVPDSTINSIANVHPAEAKRLSNLIPRLQKGEETANEVKSLTAKAKELIKQSQQEYWKATAARARAREIAMQVGYDEGAVSAPAFAGKIFTGPEAKEITRAINKDLQSTAPSILRAVNKVNAISRYFMLAGDFSPLFIQLLYLAGGNPAVYGKAAIGALRGLMSPQFLTNYYANNRDLLNANPDLILSRGGSTEFTEAMQKGGLLSSKLRLIPQEENFLKQVGLFAPRLLGKTGATLLEPFQRFFETALDVAGIEMRKGLDFLAKDPKSIEEVNMFINEFRGLASSERIGVSPSWREGETATLLAPRYNRAIASLLFDLGRNNIRGKLAREYLAMGITAVVAMAIVISLARREDPLKHLDPRSTEFLTWNIAGQQVGPGSKVRSVIRLMGQWTKAIQDGNEEDLFAFSMDNPSIRFLRGNLSPAVGTAIDLITGRNFIGDPTRDSMMHFTKEVLIGNLTPIWVENALMEGGTTLERGVRGLVEFLGGRAYPETTWDKVKPLREKYAKEDFGTDYESLNSAQIDELKRNHSDLAKLEEGASKEWAEKGTDFERWYFDETERVVKQRNENLELAAQALLDGKISKYEYDNQRGYIRPYYSGGRAVLWSAKEALDAKAVERINRWMDENLSPEDKYMNQYREYESELIEKSDLPIDWNTIEKDTFNWLAQLPTKYRDYILEHKDDWIKDLPEAARQIEAERLTGIDNGRWWDGYRESGVGGGLPSIGSYSQNRQTPGSSTLPPVKGYSQNRGQ